jgi:hypothetical protein
MSITEEQVIKKLDDISQEIKSLQKAHAHTRGQIEGLRAEFFVNLTTARGLGGRE